MKLLKLAFFSFLLLFLLVTAMSMFIPSHVIISRAVNIKADKAAVMTQLSQPDNWKNWYPGIDSAKVFMEQGQARGVVLGAKKSITLRLTAVKPDEVNAEFRSSMRPVLNGWKVIEHPRSDSLTVQWYMDFHLHWYPWEKFSSLLFDKSYGPQMEKGLGSLKNILVSNRP